MYQPTQSAKSDDQPGVDLETLIDDHQVSIWQYLRALGCEFHEADDLTQETFLTVFRRPFHYYGRAAAAGYLRRVAFHRFVVNCRRTNKTITVGDFEEFDERRSRWTGDSSPDPLLDVLADCLACLPERSRLSLQMRFRDGLPRKQIADKLSITEHGVRNLMQRAKRKLRDSIERKIRDKQPAAQLET